MTPVTTFAGRRVALFGLGGSGLVTALALKAGGADVVAFDDSEQSREKAIAQGIPVADLGTEDWSRFAALVLAPGVPLTHPVPHWTVEMAGAAGIEVIGDIELFCRERAEIAPLAPFVAIAGNEGTATTAALVAHILEKAGRDVQITAGKAILALKPPSRDRVHVVDVSAAQIDLTPSFHPSLRNDSGRPTIGVLLNAMDDSSYRPTDGRTCSALLTSALPWNGLSVLGMDDPECLKVLDTLEHTEWYPPIKISGARRLTTKEVTAPTMNFNEGVFVDNDIVTICKITYDYLRFEHRPLRSKDERRQAEFSPQTCMIEEVSIACLTESASLRGQHDGQNAAAATAVSMHLDCSYEDIAHGLLTFPGLAWQPTSRREAQA